MLIVSEWGFGSFIPLHIIVEPCFKWYDNGVMETSIQWIEIESELGCNQIEWNVFHGSLYFVEWILQGAEKSENMTDLEVGIVQHCLAGDRFIVHYI